MSNIDARRALTKIINTLTSSNGHFVWTALGDPKVWLLRVPKEKKGEDVWTSKVHRFKVHVCRPIKVYEAIESNKQEKVSEFTGYVVDNKCIRCTAEIPESVDQKMEIQIKLYKLGKKVD